MNEPRCAGFFLERKDESVGRRGDSGELAARPVDAVAATRWVTLVARDFSTAPFWELSAARRVAALAAMRPVALVARGRDMNWYVVGRCWLTCAFWSMSGDTIC